MLDMADSTVLAGPDEGTQKGPSPGATLSRATSSRSKPRRAILALAVRLRPSGRSRPRHAHGRHRARRGRRGRHLGRRPLARAARDRLRARGHRRAGEGSRLDDRRRHHHDNDGSPLPPPPPPPRGRRRSRRPTRGSPSLKLRVVGKVRHGGRVMLKVRATDESGIRRVPITAGKRKAAAKTTLKLRLPSGPSGSRSPVRASTRRGNATTRDAHPPLRRVAIHRFL
jgi:hypothetical protein